MKELGRIRRMFHRDGISLSEISRKTGYSRNTLKRWLRAEGGVEPVYQRRSHDTKVAPYAVQLIKALETDAHRPKRDRRSALKLFGEIKAAGFTGDYVRWQTDREYHSPYSESVETRVLKYLRCGTVQWYQAAK